MKSLSDTALWTQTHNNRLLLEISINITLCACMRFCYRGGFRNVWCVSVHILLPGPCYQVLTVTHEVTPRTTKRWIAFDTWLYVYISPWVTLVIISWLCIQDKQPLTDVCLTRLPIFAFFLGFCVKGYIVTYNSSSIHHCTKDFPLLLKS